MRRLLRAGESTALLVAIMFVGSLALWVGAPLGALYVGSRVQTATDSLGAAMGVTVTVFLVVLAALLYTLGWLNRKHMEVRAARGLDDLGLAALEGVLVVSAGLAALGFGIWFFFVSGSEPVPFLGGGSQ
ncbi:MAG TPA: hypothetical protein VF520_14890 [Thermoleophilaceae bacterium]|jgi:uncharacterized membrane protein YbhN (UPF0104 family)